MEQIKQTNESLIPLIQAGDEQAKEQFVKQNTPLIYSLIKRFSHRQASKEELFQVGCIGLMKALNHFSFKYDVTFSTYAVPIIIGEIKRYFRDDGKMHISRSLKEGYYKVMQEMERFVQEHHRQPTYQELAINLNMDVHEVLLCMDAHQFIYSLEEPVYQSDGSHILLEDQVAAHVELDVISKTALMQEIHNLTQREQMLLYNRYTLGMKQDDIAKQFQVSQVQISRMEKKIIQKLRNKFKAE